MDEVRQVLLIPIGFCVIIFCLLAILIWLDLRGKLTPSSLKSIRNNFDKAHPGLSRKLTIGLAVFLGIVFIGIFHSYTLDYIDGEYLVTSGTVERITYSKTRTEERIYVNKETYYVWLRNPKVEVNRNYEIHYTPRSKIIIRVFEVQ